MHKPHRHERHPRHGVIPMRDPIIAPPLVRNKTTKRNPAHTRRAERVQSDVVALDAQSGGRERGDGAAQAVARDGDAVGRVLCHCGLESGEHGGAGVEPGGPEAGVGGAAGAERGGCEGEVEVREPVGEAGGAAEGEDDEGVGGVGGQVAGYVCGGVGSEGCE